RPPRRTRRSSRRGPVAIPDLPAGWRRPAATVRPSSRGRATLPGVGDSKRSAEGLGQQPDDGARSDVQPSGAAPEPEGYRGAADRTPAHFRRLHPLTPLLRGWAFIAAGLAYVGQDAFRTDNPGRLLLIVPVIAIIGFAFGFASWWFTRYGFDGDDLRIDSGILHRRSRRVRMDRLQAVDVVRPLAGRLLGLSELRMEVAGGGESEAPLAYLSADDAVRLRAELLARSAGIDADT